MAKLNIHNNYKPNLKGQRLKKYIAKNEEKLKELEHQLQLEEEIFKKLLSKHNEEDEEGNE